MKYYESSKETSCFTNKGGYILSQKIIIISLEKESSLSYMYLFMNR